MRLFGSTKEAQIAEAVEQQKLRSEEANQHKFSGILNHEQREKLRGIVRREHLKHYPEEFLTDLECDKFIDSFGEGYVEAQLRRKI